ncbi:MAG: hypothetical protein EBY32_18205 [Proteobacteria bacterium]|nr:hypothetical protein [Pseudomonadota bacterium]
MGVIELASAAHRLDTTHVDTRWSTYWHFKSSSKNHLYGGTSLLWQTAHVKGIFSAQNDEMNRTIENRPYQLD